MDEIRTSLTILTVGKSVLHKALCLLVIEFEHNKNQQNNPNAFDSASTLCECFPFHSLSVFIVAMNWSSFVTWRFFYTKLCRLSRQTLLITTIKFQSVTKNFDYLINSVCRLHLVTLRIGFWLNWALLYLFDELNEKLQPARQLGMKWSRARCVDKNIFFRENV